MTSSDPTEKKLLIPSDHLRSFIELLSYLPGIEALSGSIYRTVVIVDTNAVLSDLNFLAIKRRKPETRTDIQELMATGICTVVAPPELEVEVEKNLPGFAKGQGIEEEVLWSLWADYKTSVKICDWKAIPGILENEGRDPDDHPFLYLQHHLQGQPIITRDRDIEGMGGTVISREILVDLRDYARAKSIVVSYSVCNTAIIAMGMGTVYGVWKGLPALANKVPKEIWVVAGILFGTALLRPESRNRIFDTIGSTGKKAGNVLGGFLKILAELVMLQNKEEARAQEKLTRFQERFSVRRPPLAVYAFIACAEAERPLTTDEIARRVKIAGYHSKAKDPKRYLRRILGKSQLIIRKGDGRWTVKTTQYLEEHGII